MSPNGTVVCGLRDSWVHVPLRAVATYPRVVFEHSQGVSLEQLVQADNLYDASLLRHSLQRRHKYQTPYSVGYGVS
jgi:hypothetical protein